LVALTDVCNCAINKLSRRDNAKNRRISKELQGAEAHIGDIMTVLLDESGKRQPN